MPPPVVIAALYMQECQHHPHTAEAVRVTNNIELAEEK